jgi:hypothetical protein
MVLFGSFGFGLDLDAQGRSERREDELQEVIETLLGRRGK